MIVVVVIVVIVVVIVVIIVIAIVVIIVVAIVVVLIVIVVVIIVIVFVIIVIIVVIIVIVVVIVAVVVIIIVVVIVIIMDDLKSMSRTYRQGGEANTVSIGTSSSISSTFRTLTEQGLRALETLCGWSKPPASKWSSHRLEPCRFVRASRQAQETSMCGRLVCEAS